MGLMAAEEALNLNDSLRHRFEVLDATKHEWIYAQLALKRGEMVVCNGGVGIGHTGFFHFVSHNCW